MDGERGGIIAGPDSAKCTLGVSDRTGGVKAEVEEVPLARAREVSSLERISSAMSLEPALKWREMGSGEEISMRMCLALSGEGPAEVMADVCHFCTGV